MLANRMEVLKTSIVALKSENNIVERLDTN